MSQEILDELLNKKSFLRKIKEAAQVAEISGFEAGFVVVRQKRGVICGKVTAGSVSSWPSESKMESGRGLRGLQEGTVHFHDLSLIPSCNDLRNISGLQKRDEWMMIGRMNWRGKIDILFMHPFRKIPFYEAECWEKVAESIDTEKEMIEALFDFSISAIRFCI